MDTITKDKTTEYLNRVKEKLAISSNYAVAKALEIERQRINDYYRGDRVPDSYACTKIAILLGEDPTLVIAEIQAENEKNAKKKGFWRDFALRVGKLAVVIAASIFMLFSAPEPVAANGGKNGDPPDRTSHYTKWSALVRAMRALAALFYRRMAPNIYTTLIIDSTAS